jgi:hypothetical protein
MLLRHASVSRAVGLLAALAAPLAYAQAQQGGSPGNMQGVGWWGVLLSTLLVLAMIAALVSLTIFLVRHSPTRRA